MIPKRTTAVVALAVILSASAGTGAAYLKYRAGQSGVIAGPTIPTTPRNLFLTVAPTTTTAVSVTTTVPTTTTTTTTTTIPTSETPLEPPQMAVEAPAPSPEPVAPPQPSVAPVSDIEIVIAFAQAQHDDPYVWGGNGPDVWDCSGLVVAAFRQIGISLPRTTWQMLNVGVPISRGEMQRGDLVFMEQGGHMGIYVGDNMFVNAASGNTMRVVTSVVYEFYAARRVH